MAMLPPDKKIRASRLARSFDTQVFNFYLPLKRHQRRPESGAVIKVAKKEAASQFHIRRYSIAIRLMCQGLNRG
jgi:hypothetical protein